MIREKQSVGGYVRRTSVIQSRGKIAQRYRKNVGGETYE